MITLDVTTEALQLITSQGGTIVVLIAAIYTLYKGYWAPKSVIEDKDKQIAEWKQQANKWMEQALRGTDLATKATDLMVAGDEKTKAP